MQIKRKDLKEIRALLHAALQETPVSLPCLTEAYAAVDTLLFWNPPPDPVDVVPIQDYPFTIGCF